MNPKEGRDIVINRVRKELIGPGSDIFLCNPDYTDEVIEGKPLQRYFSAILFPKQKIGKDEDNTPNDFSDNNDNPPDDNGNEFSNNIDVNNSNLGNTDEDNDSNDQDGGHTDTQPKYVSKSFFPSHYGITFSTEKSCKTIKTQINFGNYDYSAQSVPPVPEQSVPLKNIDRGQVRYYFFCVFLRSHLLIPVYGHRLPICP